MKDGTDGTDGMDGTVNSYSHSGDLTLGLPKPDSPHHPFYSMERPGAGGGDQVLLTMA